LESDHFTLEKKIKLYNEDSANKNKMILIYRMNGDIPETREDIRIRLPIIGSEIRVPLKTLPNFYTPADDKISILRESFRKNK